MFVKVLFFHLISDSNHIGTLNTIEHVTTQHRYFIRFLFLNLELTNDRLWMNGRLTATYLSYAMETVINIDDVKLIFVNGRKTYGYIKMWISVNKLKASRNLSTISKNTNTLSEMNNPINKLLKKTLFDARDDNMHIAVIFSINPSKPTPHSMMPLIQ